MICRMGGDLYLRRSPAVRRPGATALHDRTRASGPALLADRFQQLQRQAGNQAMLSLLQREARAAGVTQGHTVQRDVGSHRENPPVSTLQPAGTLSEEQWTAAYRAAVAKPSVEAYEPLFRDIALTAGMAELAAGFVPSTVPVSDGKTAKPGLDMTLNTSDEPGHTAWVDKNGAFGVPLKLDSGTAPDVSVAIILSPRALSPDKALSLRSARHEMVHARHKTKVLEGVKAWQSSPGRRQPGFDEWLKQQATKKTNPISALDVALIGSGAKNGAANTKVLAYVEGFMTDFHRRLATAAQTGPAFFELLGAVETRKLYTWAQADPAVQVEALARLREYRDTLDIDHQWLWREWLDKELAKAANDKTGRKDFLARLTAFVT
jgi:hypothetical protein